MEIELNNNNIDTLINELMLKRKRRAFCLVYFT